MDNIDAAVLNNLGDGLAGVIAGTPYQPASAEAVNPGVNLVSAGEPGQSAGVGQPGNVVAPGQVVQAPRVTPSMQPQIDPAEHERLRQVAFEASAARIEAEEARFEAEIAHLSEDEQRVAILERQLEQTSRVNNWLNNRVQTHEQSTVQQRQEFAKRQRAFLMARQAGLPFEDETVRTTLMTAQNPQHMANLVQGMVRLIGENRANQARSQLNGGMFAAGGSSAGSTGPNLRQMERSGDLTGLIGSRGYTTVNWG